MRPGVPLLLVLGALAAVSTAVVAARERHGRGSAGPSASRVVLPGFSYRPSDTAPHSIPAIVRPRFDSAAAASSLLQPSDLVMGVQIAGDARAYPVKLLALHEAVDDVVGGRPILVTWCPLCSSALVFDRRVAGKTLTFEVAGVLYRSNEVLIDRQTRSLWSQLGEGAGSGLLRGKRLRLVPAAEQTWRAWRAAHPQTRVLSLRHDVFASSFIHPYTYFDDRGEEASDDPYFSYKLKVPLRNGHRAVRGLSGAAHVVAFEAAGRSKVYPQPLLERRKVVDDAFAGVPLVVFWNDSAQTASVFSRRVGGRSLSFRWDGAGFRDTATGSRWSGSTGRAIAGPLAGTDLQALPYTLPYWFAWHWFHPDAVIAGSNGR